MPKGVKGKRGGDKAKAEHSKPIPVWVWAQCDNAGCQKWRKLPPGTQIDDEEPWFCYMNPNEDRNDCNIPEEEYNEATEAAIYSHPPSEAASMERDVSWTDAREMTPTPAQRQRQKRNGHINGRSYRNCMPEPAGNALLQNRHLEEAVPRRQMRGQELDNGHPAADELAGAEEPGWTPEEAGDTKGVEGRDGGAKWLQSSRGVGKARRAHTGFNKLLAIGGVWEITKGKGKAVTAPPAWVWEGLSVHAPEGAQLACQAADASSAARYFEIVQAPKGPDQARDAANTARLALTAAAALGVAETARIPGINDSPPSGSQGAPTSEASPGLPDSQPEVVSPDMTTALWGNSWAYRPQPPSMLPPAWPPQTQGNSVQLQGWQPASFPGTPSTPTAPMLQAVLPGSVPPPQLQQSQLPPAQAQQLPTMLQPLQNWLPQSSGPYAHSMPNGPQLAVQFKMPMPPHLAVPPHCGSSSATPQAHKSSPAAVVLPNGSSLPTQSALNGAARESKAAEGTQCAAKTPASSAQEATGHAEGPDRSGSLHESVHA